MANKKKVVPSRVKGSAPTKKSRKLSRNKPPQLTEVPPPVFQQQPQQPNVGTAITATPRPQTAAIISAAAPGVELMKNLYDIDDEALGEYIEQQFRGICLTLRHLLPFIADMKKRFNGLPRGKQADGTYQTIRGCRSFKEWTEAKLRRSERTVYYLLAGGNPQNEKAKLERKAAKQRNENPRYKDHHTVTLTGGSPQLAVVTNKTKESVEKRTVPSSHSLVWSKVLEKIRNAKSAIEVLRDETLKPENAQDTSGHKECVQAFEQVIKQLDRAASAADNAYIAFNHSRQVRRERS